MKDYEAQLGVKIEYSITGPAEEVDAEGYVSALENAIASQPGPILTATLNIDPTVPKAKEAHDAGIVLNFVNCGLGGDEGRRGHSWRVLQRVLLLQHHRRDGRSAFPRRHG